jgi:hypothetical protein
MPCRRSTGCSSAGSAATRSGRRGRDRPPLKTHTDDMPGLPPPTPLCRDPLRRTCVPRGHADGRMSSPRAAYCASSGPYGDLGPVRIIESVGSACCRVQPSSHVCVWEIARQLSRDGSGTRAWVLYPDLCKGGDPTRPESRARQITRPHIPWAERLGGLTEQVERRTGSGCSELDWCQQERSGTARSSHFQGNPRRGGLLQGPPHAAESPTRRQNVGGAGL